ncbi:MAG: hypothetical protein WD689_05675 [Gaiellaceae bacterium]
MGGGPYLAQRCVELLSTAAPALPVTEHRDPWHGVHARADLPDARSVQFAYLYPAKGARLAIALYPGDTLQQARVLYQDPRRVERLLALRADAWNVEPNFHFGFMEKGLTWTRSRLDADAYSRYWIERIEALGVLRREDWRSSIPRLIADGIMDRQDVDQFDRDFTNTRRQVASPRPGLRLEKEWPLTQALETAFATTTLRTALGAAVAALGEQQVALGAR